MVLLTSWILVKIVLHLAGYFPIELFFFKKFELWTYGIHTHTQLISRDGHTLQQRAMVIYMKIWVTKFFCYCCNKQIIKKFSDLSSKHLFFSFVICLTTGWPCIIVHGAQLDSGLWGEFRYIAHVFIFTKGKHYPGHITFMVDTGVKKCNPLSIGFPRQEPHKNQNYSELIEQTKSKLYPRSVWRKCVLYPKRYGEMGEWKK